MGREGVKDNSHILGKIIGLDGDEIQGKAVAAGGEGGESRLKF